MSNVINLADHPRANADAESRAKRVEALQARVDAGYKLLPADQERIAENLYRLLVRLEAERRVRRADVCRDVLGGQADESTKRLRNYALNPEKAGKARERQLGSLAKGAAKYVELARKAAGMAGEDVDAVLLDLVHGTALARTEALPPEDPMTKDLKGAMIRHLERAAAKVASETGLQRTFQMIARYPERVLDPWFAADDYPNNIVVAGPVNEILPYLEDGSASPPPGSDGCDWWRLAQSAPAVLLGEVILAQLEAEPRLECFARSIKFEGHKPWEGDHWAAFTDYRLQVWLALLPFGPSHEPRLGLRLQLLRHVWIERTRAPFAPPPPPPEGASSMQKERHDLLQRAHEYLQRRGDHQALKVVLSKRIPDLNQSAVLSSRAENLRATVPVNLVPLEPWLGLLLGRELYDREGWPARVLAFSSEEAQRVLNLLDCGTISDWVGPLPDVSYSGIQPGPEPAGDDPSHEAWGWARQQADEQNQEYRFRFSHFHAPAREERYPMSWKAGTLGYKLERSLLEVDGDNGVVQQLRAAVEALTANVRKTIDAAINARDERLARLHSS